MRSQISQHIGTPSLQEGWHLFRRRLLWWISPCPQLVKSLLKRCSWSIWASLLCYSSVYWRDTHRMTGHRCRIPKKQELSGLWNLERPYNLQRSQPYMTHTGGQLLCRSAIRTATDRRYRSELSSLPVHDPISHWWHRWSGRSMDMQR